jgi:hypothetical protein
MTDRPDSDTVSHEGTKNTKNTKTNLVHMVFREASCSSNLRAKPWQQDRDSEAA